MKYKSHQALIATICLNENNLKETKSAHKKSNLHITMSNLAPFVAAAIRDQVSLDLKIENNKMLAKLSSFKEAKIKGRGGSPVYLNRNQIEY